MLRVLELFAGIGACSKALTNLGIEHEIVDAVEIDKYAVKSFNAVHGTNFEPQDITKWDKDIECDLIMHGSPCQDFSVAGKGAGGDKDSGTRSSLMYETLRIVEKLKPKYVIWENVKNLLSKKHRHNFDAYLDAMTDLGYANNYQVLNAKDYGIPQNRERVFTVSIRNDLDVDFKFPEPQKLTIRLKDILEPQVDEKYYLSDEQTKRLKTTTYDTVSKKACDGRQPKIVARTDSHQKGGVYETNSVSPTLTATTYKQPTQIAEPKCVRVGGLYDSDKSKHQAGSVYDSQGIAATLSTMQGGNQEPIIVASRGRNPNNPSDRTTGAPTVQRLEPRKDGATNTITSVQKDNYVAEPQSALVQPVDRDYKKNGRQRQTHIEMKDDGISHNLRTNGETMVVEPMGGVQIIDDINDKGVVMPDFRIRKLTPLECWRLMGFSDDDFKKAQSAGISNSQLYKQAGNSIVVDVLMAILNNLIGGKDDGTRGESNHKED